MNPHLLFLVTEDWYFCSHRLALAVAARAAGYRVSVVTQVSRHGERIRDAGLDLVPVRFPRSGRRPLTDLALLARLAVVYRRLRPDIAHHVAVKPVLYGALAATLAGTPATVNALAGLGYLYTSTHARARLLRGVLRPALGAALRRRGAFTIVQNPDDERALRDTRLLDHERVVRIAGSGVDVERFVPTPEPPGPPLVVLPARLLWDKGVGEFVAAARLLRGRGVEARFALVGERDAENPSAVSDAELEAWRNEGVIECAGRRDDMPAVYAEAALVCLPSYREGLPKVLLEAGAAGRPAVTTDVPGCREVVRDGVNGLLVPARDAGALAEALARLLADAALRARFGAAARERVLREFADTHIIGQTLALYEQALAVSGGGASG